MKIPSVKFIYYKYSKLMRANWVFFVFIFITFISVIFLFLFNSLLEYVDTAFYLEHYDDGQRANLQRKISPLIKRISWQKQSFLEIYEDNSLFEFENSANLIYIFYTYPREPGFKLEMFQFLLKDEYIHKALRESNILIEIYLVLNESKGGEEVWMNSWFVEQADIWNPSKFFYLHWGKMKEEGAIAGADHIRLEVYRVRKYFNAYRYVTFYVKPLPNQK